jgi:hypothetical protein
VNRDVVRFIALDEILRVFFRGVVDITLEPNVGNNLPCDDAANPARLRIPSNVITTLEGL